MKKKPRQKTIQNRKAHFNYEEVNDLEVGMVLTGEEVKAIRAGHMQLTGSYGRVLQGTDKPELWLVGAQIMGITGDKQRSRKLLAHRREIDRLIGLIGQKGYTLVPKRVYFKNHNIKLLLAISKGLKTHEKRAKLREKDINRDISRAIRQKG
jgi:SsrA-binding protein